MTSSTATPVIPARDVVLVDPDTGDEVATVTATVVSVVRREEPGLLTGMASAALREADPHYGYLVGLDACLEIALPDDPKADTYFVSRLVGEPYWVQDAHFGRNGSPDFSHGFGARYLKIRGIHKALEALLDEAARTLGLAAEIGPDTPLVLAASGPDDGAQTPACP